MAFRFFRRFRIAPGVTVNLSKRGGSLSFGPRGAKVSMGTRGVRRTLGLPGTGLFYTTHHSYGQTRRRREPAPPRPRVPPRDRLTLGFFQRLLTLRNERSLVAGLRDLTAGREREALSNLRRAADLADGAFLAGFLLLERERFADAERLLRRALERQARLGRYLRKYGVDVAMTLPITPEITAQVGPSVRGIHLALAELHQQQGQWRKALASLEHLRGLDRDDPVVLLALVELLYDHAGKDGLKRIVRLTKDVSNESAAHAAVLYFKGRALHRLDLLAAARDTLTAAFRRKKDRPYELLLSIQYERALVYEALGQARRAQRELEKIYADAPEFEDVARRLGLA